MSRHRSRNGVEEARSGSGVGTAGHDSGTGAAPFLKLGSAGS